MDTRYKFAQRNCKQHTATDNTAALRAATSGGRTTTTTKLTYINEGNKSRLWPPSPARTTKEKLYRQID